MTTTYDRSDALALLAAEGIADALVSGFPQKVRADVDKADARQGHVDVDLTEFIGDARGTALDDFTANYLRYINGHGVPVKRLVLTGPEEVDGPEFAEHVRRANLIHEKQTPITLAFDADEVSVSATGADRADAAATMPCQLEGEPLTVKVNPDYLANALRQVGAGEVALEFVGPRQGFRVLPVGGTGYRHLVMPIRK
jgi:DNA polymerase III sliding clamp (beta) subunit (PCNA family)